jgi:AraC family transcriptional regulator
MDLRADANRKYPDSRLLATSAGRAWGTLYAELRSHPAGRIRSSLQQHVEVCVAVSGSGGQVVRSNAGRCEQGPAATGTIWIAPAGLGTEELMITAEIPQILHLYIPGRQFHQLTEQHNLSRSPLGLIRYIGGVRDELIHQIALSVRAELTRETSTGRMFAESSSIMLASQLVHSYSDGSLLLKPEPGQLGNARLRRVLDHIEEHLDQELTVAQLAGVVALSPFHFSRMFAAAMGTSPWRYVSRRRIEDAKVQLTAGRLCLGEIAYRTRFSSTAAFSRAFRRATGMTPGEYRRAAR